MTNEIREKVMEMLVDVLAEEGEGIGEIGPDDDLSEFGVNSMTFIRLVLALEMEFGVSWEDDDLQYQNFLTLNNIIRYVEATMASTSA
ncbi:phosphopantetheine-binding protein [Paenibacillus curdlanolyticus YK9]|uniref:Phosphopantetheine-binding protein n=1 Tax=Paenibacillus curdlanolyticus YK9 TaxID=717606 RepID=E0IGA4_9BACL|nr:acyl carrier protein [Paenibacillus curdlanolyticus]EFM08506.1 phosphopantetheine-binding protein [Paenibacillus curdlanolyticus YK9]